MVIPAMDHLDSFLATAALDKEYLPSIQASVTIGKKLLNKYYDITDHSEVYRIAMGMFPTYLLCVLNVLLTSTKFCTPATNSNISRGPDGTMNGLRLPAKSFRPSSTVRMHSWRLMNRTQFSLNLYVRPRQSNLSCVTHL